MPMSNTVHAKTPKRKIVVFKEKHGDRYFDASTPELTRRALLRVFRDRAGEGYWYERPAMPDLSRSNDYLKISDDVLVTLPATLQREVKTARRVVANAKLEYEENMKWYDNLMHVISLPDDEAIALEYEDSWTTEAGKQIISKSNMLEELYRARSDYEYETWDIISLETA